MKKELVGLDWVELVNYFGLEQKYELFLEKEDVTIPESAEKVYYFGAETIKVSTSEKEHVEEIKLRNFIQEKLQEHEESNEVREVLNEFLDKLIENGKDYLIEDTLNMLKEIRNIQINSEFCWWFINNLEAMWI